MINEITRRKKQTRNALRKLKFENGSTLENPRDIANALNEYFVLVGPKLAEKLPVPESSFQDYLHSDKSPSESFTISPTNCEEILKVINSFSSSNCEGPDHISPRLFKLGSKSLCVLLTNMVNQRFFQGYFPKCLKTAKATGQTTQSNIRF